MHGYPFIFRKFNDFLEKTPKSNTDNFNAYLALSNFSNSTTNWRFLKFKGKKTPITRKKNANYPWKKWVIGVFLPLNFEKRQFVVKLEKLDNAK